MHNFFSTHTHTHTHTHTQSKMSTKCWAFLEREDLKEGIHLLELYKKPIDVKRKKLSLLSVKAL
jgi:hypothetical protein